MGLGVGHATTCGCALCTGESSSEKANANIGFGAPSGGGGDGLIGGKIWTGKTVSYGFPADAFSYDQDPLADGIQYGEGEAANGFAPVSTSQVNVSLNVIAAIESISLLRFTYDETNPEIRIAQSAAPLSAWAYFPDDDAEGGDVWIGRNNQASDNPARGDYGWHAFFHEIGHAVGLKHGHEPGVLGAGGTLAADRDMMEWSVMTYRSFQGDKMEGGYSNEAYGYAQSFMRADIAALQQLYGANYDHLSSDTHYAWNAATGELSINGTGQGAPVANRIFETLWDGGGVDVIDASNYTNGVEIDLSPGAGALLSGEQLAWVNRSDQDDAPIFASANVFFAELHEGDERGLFENALGGGGNDTLVGNSGANSLSGGEGADDLNGAAGDDHLIGGRGGDVMLGGVGKDRLQGQSGHDHLAGGAGKDHLFGGGGRDELFGLQGRDRLNGGGGADDLEGGRGGDVLTGGAGPDTFRFAKRDGVDQVTDFGLGADRLDFSAVADSFGSLRFIETGMQIRVAADGFQVILLGVTADELTPDQFLF